MQAALGDLVDHWTTLNEPRCPATPGTAPACTPPVSATWPNATGPCTTCCSRTVWACGRCATAPGSGTGSASTLDLMPVRPASASAADAAAARRVDTDDTCSSSTRCCAARTRPGPPANPTRSARGDLDVIGAPIDFLGINYYTPDSPSGPRPTATLRAEVVRPAGAPVTDDGLAGPAGRAARVAGRPARRHPRLPPIYITENGAAYPDQVSADGTVHDPRRVAYLRRHLLALHEAISAGVDVRGYFVWSLMDNFEWAQGYACRFGIVHVDYADQRRTPKTSARWYGQVARGNAVPRT